MREGVRKRGYYRALKRNEDWAVSKKILLSIMGDIEHDLYARIGFEASMKILSLDNMIKEKI